MIVSKVFLGRSVPIREGEPVEACNYPKAHSVHRSFNPENGIKTRGGRDNNQKHITASQVNVVPFPVVVDLFPIERFHYRENLLLQSAEGL